MVQAKKQLQLSERLVARVKEQLQQTERLVALSLGAVTANRTIGGSSNEQSQQTERLVV